MTIYSDGLCEINVGGYVRGMKLDGWFKLQAELEEARKEINFLSGALNAKEAQLSEKDAVIENIAKALNNLVAYHQPIEHPHIPNKACPFCIGKETLAEIGEK